MQLPFSPTQEEYDAWHAWHMERVNNPDDMFTFSDLNDGIMVFAAAQEIAKARPDKLPELEYHTPTAVDNAMNNLGIFMGVTYLAGKIGINPEDARKAVFRLWNITPKEE